jgi:ATP-dependent protease ClpP protease subunit
MKLLAILAAFVNLSFAQAPVAGPKYTISLHKDNSVVFRGVVDQSSVAKAEAELLELIIKRGNKTYPIYLTMDSPGGEIGAGLDFIRFLHQYKNIDTISIFAASMASAIVEANHGQRFVVENGILMFHRAAGGFQGNFEDGEVESQLLLAKNMVRGMELVNARRMGIGLNEYKMLVHNELWLIDSHTVDMGAADAIVAVNCSNELIQNKETVTVQVMIFQMQLEFSKCPLVRAGNGKSAKDSQLIIKNQKELRAKRIILKELT